MINLLKTVRTWTNGAVWRSWLAHAVLGLPICLVAGPVALVTFYTVREAEQVAHRLMDGIPLYWTDHMADVLAPAAVAALWWGLDWPVLL